VDVLITDLAVFHFANGVMTLVKVMSGASLEQVSENTTTYYEVALQKS